MVTPEHFPLPTRLEDIASPSFAELPPFDRFERVRFAIENGDITDPRILDAYFVVGEQFYTDANKKEYQQRQQFGLVGFDTWLNAGEIEMRRLQTAPESEKIAYCADQGKRYLQETEFRTQTGNKMLLAWGQKKAVNWYNMAAARARMSLSSTPPSTPGAAPQRK